MMQAFPATTQKRIPLQKLRPDCVRGVFLRLAPVSRIGNTFPRFVAIGHHLGCAGVMLCAMNLSTSLFRGFTWRRSAIALILATLAAAIIFPYFIPGRTTFYLVWFRMAITALTMFAAFTITGNALANSAKRENAQYAALVFGAFLGAILSGFAIGRTLTEMFTEDAKFLGLIVSAAAGIAVGVIGAMLAMYRERSARAAGRARSA